jgi:hypothetical protein
MSAEDAVEAAEQTAKALREATREALEDARRAGQALRREPGAAAPTGQTSPAAGVQRLHVEDLGEPAPRSVPAARPAPEDAATAQGRGKWKTVLFALDDERKAKAAPAWRQPAEAATIVLAPPVTQEWSAQARAVVERTGARVEGVLGVTALERIAAASKRNAAARRRAVRDAAPDTVLKLVQAMERDPQMRAGAESLLAAEGRSMEAALLDGRAPLSAEPTRLFLLLDAACG